MSTYLQTFSTPDGDDRISPGLRDDRASTGDDRACAGPPAVDDGDDDEAQEEEEAEEVH